MAHRHRGWRKAWRIVAGFSMMAATASWGGEPELLTGFGVAGVLQDWQTGLYAIEYRPAWRAWDLVGAWVSAETTFVAGYWLGLGVFLEGRFGPHWLIRPSFGGGYYHQSGDFDLGSPLEFRSTFELDFNLTPSWLIGLAISHYSNGGIADKNPGAESVRAMIGYRF